MCCVCCGTVVALVLTCHFCCWWVKYFSSVVVLSKRLMHWEPQTVIVGDTLQCFHSENNQKHSIECTIINAPKGCQVAIKPPHLPWSYRFPFTAAVTWLSSLHTEKSEMARSAANQSTGLVLVLTAWAHPTVNHPIQKDSETKWHSKMSSRCEWESSYSAIAQ